MEAAAEARASRRQLRQAIPPLYVATSNLGKSWCSCTGIACRNCRRRSSFFGGPCRTCSLLPTKIPAASAGVSGILRGGLLRRGLQTSVPASSAASSGRRRDQHRHHGGPPGHLQARAKVLFPPHSPAGIHPDHHTSTTRPRVFFNKKNMARVRQHHNIFNVALRLVRT